MNQVNYSIDIYSHKSLNFKENNPIKEIVGTILLSIIQNASTSSTSSVIKTNDTIDNDINDNNFTLPSEFPLELLPINPLKTINDDNTSTSHNEYWLSALLGIPGDATDEDIIHFVDPVVTGIVHLTLIRSPHNINESIFSSYQNLKKDNNSNNNDNTNDNDIKREDIHSTTTIAILWFESYRTRLSFANVYQGMHFAKGHYCMPCITLPLRKCTLSHHKDNDKINDKKKYQEKVEKSDIDNVVEEKNKEKEEIEDVQTVKDKREDTNEIEEEKKERRDDFLVRYHQGEASHVQLQDLPLTQLLPSCPLCLARIEGAFSGLKAELMPDLFSFMAADSMRCFVCRVSDPVMVNATTATTTSTCTSTSNTSVLGCPRAACMSCGVRENIWTCLICGHLGCGRYTAQHSLHHFSSYGHNFSLELATGRIWDYDRDTFVHSQDSQAVVSIGNGVTLGFGGELGLAPLLERYSGGMSGVGNDVTSYTGQSMTSQISNLRHIHSDASCNDNYRNGSSSQMYPTLNRGFHPLNREAAMTMANEGTVARGVLPYLAPDIQQTLSHLSPLPSTFNTSSNMEEQTQEKLHGMMDGYERIFEEQLELQRQYYEVLLARETRLALERKQIQMNGGTAMASAVTDTQSITTASEDNGACLPQIDGAESDHYWGLKLAYAVSSEDDMNAIENLKREISALEDELSCTTREATEAEAEHRNMRRQNNGLVKQIQVLKERVGGFQNRKEEILERKTSEETMLLEQIRDLEQHLHTQEQIFHSDRGIREEIQTGNFIITEADNPNANRTAASTNTFGSSSQGDIKSNKSQKQKQKRKQQKKSSKR